MTPNAAAGRMLVLLCTLVLAQSVPAADTYVATPSSYLSLLRKLRPGDTLVLSPGRYHEGMRLHNINGAAGNPIVIRGSRDAPTTLVARPNANTVSIVNSSYIELRDLVLDGDGQLVDAIKAEGKSSWASHITLDGLTIHRYGADQQVVGISTKCPAWGWVIRNNVIVGVGTGMYLGQSDGSAPFVAGIIERNLIVDSIGYNLQIKHQRERPLIAGMPDEKSVTIIRHNVFSKSASSSAGALARPNVLVGHWPRSGPGVEDTYAIYGNFFFQNPSEALFQGEGNVAFYSNVLVNTFGDAINIQPQHAVPRHVTVFHNTIVANGTGIVVTGGSRNAKQVVVANVVFARAPISAEHKEANITGPPDSAPEYLVNPYANLGELDLSPRTAKFGIQRFDTSRFRGFIDADKDFDGNVRIAAVAGAYVKAPRWQLRLQRKP